MPTRFPNRRPIARRPLPRREPTAHADPFYGHGYNPAWPSILSVAPRRESLEDLFVREAQSPPPSSPSSTLAAPSRAAS